MAGLMSLSGGVISTVVMWLLLKKANASLGVVGVCGALAHNAAQLCAAYFLTSTSVLFYVPFLLVFGVLTGLLTGLVLKLTLKPLERLQNIWGREKRTSTVSRMSFPASLYVSNSPQ